MLDNDFKYCVDYTLDGHYDCENHGCNDEGICRCYTISYGIINNVSIRKVSDQIFRHYFDTTSQSFSRDSKLFGLIHNIDKLELVYFWEYCINRLLTIHKVYKPNLWSVNWSSGYYGDEVDSVTLEKNTFNKFKSDIDFIIELNHLPEIVEFILQKEYGFILDKVKSKNWTIKEVNSEDIVFPQQNHLQKVNQSNLNYLEDSRPDDILGICIQENNKYRVVDGYHRLSYYQNKVNKITILTVC